MHQDNDNKELEIWKDVVGYEGLYQASSFGRVKSLKRKHVLTDRVLRSSNDSWGYPQVGLYRNGKLKKASIHILVMVTFKGKCPDGLQINHKDGVKTNNHLSNLEYVTPSQNSQHSYDTGLQSPLVGENHNMAKLTEVQVIEIRKRYKLGGITHSELAKQYNVSRTTITMVINGTNWKHI